MATSSARSRVIWHGGNLADAINRANGLLTKLRDTPPEHRPDQTTVGYLARHYGVSIQVMRARIADAEQKRSSNDYADNWLECIYQIGNELGETLLAKTFQIARDTSNRSSFKAQQWLLAKLDPSVYGEAAETSVQQAPARSMLSDVPQEVFDDMSDEEEAQLVEIEQMFSNAQLLLTQWVRRRQKRVADHRVQEVDNDDND